MAGPDRETEYVAAEMAANDGLHFPSMTKTERARYLRLARAAIKALDDFRQEPVVEERRKATRAR